MYQLYIIKISSFDSKKLIGEYKELDLVHERLQKELAKEPELKYIIEETTGHVDSYGELVAELVEKN